MSKIFIGLDISKGYTACYICNEQGSVLHQANHDDTREGHNQLEAALERIHLNNPDSFKLAGAESTGGYERNWVAMLKQVSSRFNIRIHTLNPYAVKRYIDGKIPRGVNDNSSAVYIAEYLRVTEKPISSHTEEQFVGVKTLYRITKKYLRESAKLKTQLLITLSLANPELVQYCRQSIPRWLLELLIKYPTARHLADADFNDLSSIRFVGIGRAKKMISAARGGIASQVDDITGETVSFMAAEILEREAKVRQLKKRVTDELTGDDGVRIIESIPGIGSWSAACLRLEIGPVERFHSIDSLVAYAGLDPIFHQSGDMVKRGPISRRGRKEIREILFPLVFSGLKCNPTVRGFYARLRGRGKCHKVAMVACMAKLLRVIYGCWISDSEYDPSRSRYSVQWEQQRAKISGAPEPVEAPVSGHEAKKRKAAARPQIDTLFNKHVVTGQRRNLIITEKD